MSDVFINVCKSEGIMIKVIALLFLQLLCAVVKLNSKVVIADAKLIISLLVASLFLLLEFIFTTGVLIGISIRRDEDEFSIQFEKYSSYFRELYTKIDKNVRQMYTITEIMDLKINV